jgi:hypothetical protein
VPPTTVGMICKSAWAHFYEPAALTAELWAPAQRLYHTFQPVGRGYLALERSDCRQCFQKSFPGGWRECSPEKCALRQRRILRCRLFSLNLNIKGQMKHCTRSMACEVCYNSSRILLGRISPLLYMIEVVTMQKKLRKKRADRKHFSVESQ